MFFDAFIDDKAEEMQDIEDFYGLCAYFSK